MKQLSLSQLMQGIQRLLRPLSSNSVWVIAELSEVNKSARGHVYIELVEKRGDQIAAKASAVIWSNGMSRLHRKLGRDLHHILRAGNQVLVQVTVDFHAVYGMKLNIQDIDPSVTLGALAVKRQAIIDRLTVEEKIDQNKFHDLPVVPQRLAVISSPKAAGLEDLLDQLKHNPYGFCFYAQLFPASMQGEATEGDVVAQLNKIAEQDSNYDLIIITRGGGSQLDLSWFDSYAIGAAIAASPLPVLTGIGHQQDQSIADLCAHSSLKTPTAVAEFLLQKTGEYAYAIRLLSERLQQNTKQHCLLAQNQLVQYKTALGYASKHRIEAQSSRIDRLKQQLRHSAPSRLLQERKRLQNIRQYINSNAVDKILEKGYSLIFRGEEWIRSTDQLQKGDAIKIRFKDGEQDFILN